MRTAIEGFRPLVVAGASGPAGELRTALAEGGDANGVRDASGRPLARGDLEDASLLVYAIEGDRAEDEDEQALKLAARRGVDAVCILVGSRSSAAVDVPHVLATDVVPARAGEPLPLTAIAERIAQRAGEDAYVLASKLPVLRRPVCEEIVRRFSRQNGVLAVAIFIPGADLPALTLNQVRMVFRIAGAYGEEIDRERALELLAVVGAGFGLRAVARQVLALVPGPGWAYKGGVAYAGTKAVGEAAIRYFEAGGTKRVLGSVRSRS